MTRQVVRNFMMHTLIEEDQNWESYDLSSYWPESAVETSELQTNQRLALSGRLT